MNADHAPPEARSTGELAGKGAAAGAAGSVATSAVVSIACGPFYAVCFAAMLPVTVGASTLVGAGTGLLVGLSAEDAEQVSRQFSVLDQTRDVNQELVAAVSARLPAERLAAPGQADARLSLGARELNIEQGTGDRFAFSLTIVTSLQWERDGRKPGNASRKYKCKSQNLGVQSWLKDGGQAFDREFSQCIADLAQTVDRALKARPGASGSFVLRHAPPALRAEDVDPVVVAPASSPIAPMASDSPDSSRPLWRVRPRGQS